MSYHPFPMAKSVLSPWRQIINFRCSRFTSGVTRFFSLMKTLVTYAQKKRLKIGYFLCFLLYTDYVSSLTRLNDNLASFQKMSIFFFNDLQFS